MDKTNQSEPFTLPKNWHVVVTEENQKEVNEFLDASFPAPVGDVVGISIDEYGNIDESPSRSGDIPGTVKDINGQWDFGQEITTEQFRKYVLNKKEPMVKEFVLPDNWVIRVTEDNVNEINKWSGETLWPGCCYAGVGSSSGMSGCVEITTEQFRKHVLKEDIKTYPRIMEVSNFEDFSNSATRVVFMEKNGKYITWGGARTLEEAEKTLSTSCWAYAREREVAPIVELTAEDISNGKGVGINPKLIRFKE